MALLGTGFGYSARRRATQAALLAQMLPVVRDVRRIGSARAGPVHGRGGPAGRLLRARSAGVGLRGRRADRGRGRGARLVACPEGPAGSAEWWWPRRPASPTSCWRPCGGSTAWRRSGLRRSAAAGVDLGQQRRIRGFGGAGAQGGQHGVDVVVVRQRAEVGADGTGRRSRRRGCRGTARCRARPATRRPRWPARPCRTGSGPGSSVGCWRRSGRWRRSAGRNPDPAVRRRRRRPDRPGRWR